MTAIAPSSPRADGRSSRIRPTAGDSNATAASPGRYDRRALADAVEIHVTCPSTVEDVLWLGALMLASGLEVELSGRARPRYGGVLRAIPAAGPSVASRGITCVESRIRAPAHCFDHAHQTTRPIRGAVLTLHINAT